MSQSRGKDVEKERYWRKTIREAARSGLSIREFCRRHELRESQFHWWQRKLKDRYGQKAARGEKGGGDDSDQAAFALVSDRPEELDAGIELVLDNGHRIRIRKGVDEETLRTVLTAVRSDGYARGA